MVDTCTSPRTINGTGRGRRYQALDTRRALREQALGSKSEKEPGSTRVAPAPASLAGGAPTPPEADARADSASALGGLRSVRCLRALAMRCAIPCTCSRKASRGSHTVSLASAPAPADRRAAGASASACCAICCMSARRAAASRLAAPGSERREPLARGRSPRVMGRSLSGPTPAKSLAASASALNCLAPTPPNADPKAVESVVVILPTFAEPASARC
jgi:hypothetical protein